MQTSTRSSVKLLIKIGGAEVHHCSAACYHMLLLSGRRLFGPHPNFSLWLDLVSRRMTLLLFCDVGATCIIDRDYSCLAAVKRNISSFCVSSCQAHPFARRIRVRDDDSPSPRRNPAGSGESTSPSLSSFHALTV